jgi:hypothetical protein
MWMHVIFTYFYFLASFYQKGKMEQPSLQKKVKLIHGGRFFHANIKTI